MNLTKALELATFLSLGFIHVDGAAVITQGVEEREAKFPKIHFGPHRGSKTSISNPSNTRSSSETPSSDTATASTSHISSSFSSRSESTSNTPSSAAPTQSWSSPEQQSDTTDCSDIRNTVTCARLAHNSPNRTICYPDTERSLPREETVCWKHCQGMTKNDPDVFQHGLQTICFSLTSPNDDIHTTPGACGCWAANVGEIIWLSIGAGVVAAMAEVIVGGLELLNVVLESTPFRLLGGVGMVVQLLTVGKKILGPGVRDCEELKWPGHKFTEIDGDDIEGDMEGLSFCGMEEAWRWMEYV